MIAGETETLLHDDFDLMQYDPDTSEEALYDDFIFGSKEKKAQRKAQRLERKRRRKARRMERRNTPERVARRQRSQGFFRSLGGVQGIGSAIDALITKPDITPTTGTTKEEDYSIGMVAKVDPDKKDNTTMYMIIGGVAITGVLTLAILQRRKNG